MGYWLIFAISSTFLVGKSVCVEDKAKTTILTYENNNSVPGRYNFKFETTDGTYREETGEITNPELDNAVAVIRGSYSYLSPEGKKYTVRYIADNQGFRLETTQPTTPHNRRLPSSRDIGGAAVSALQGGGLG